MIINVHNYHDLCLLFIVVRRKILKMEVYQMQKTIMDVLTWDEPLLNDFSESNAITIAKVKYHVSGYLNGTITSNYIIHYTHYDANNPHNAESTFTGYSLFEGEIEGHHTILTLLENGSHTSSGLLSNLVIKESANTKLTGKASYSFKDNQVVLESDFLQIV